MYQKRHNIVINSMYSYDYYIHSFSASSIIMLINNNNSVDSQSTIREFRAKIHHHPRELSFIPFEWFEWWCRNIIECTTRKRASNLRYRNEFARKRHCTAIRLPNETAKCHIKVERGFCGFIQVGLLCQMCFR